jgi:hypothetical protein
MDGNSDSTVSRGIVFAPLKEACPDRIVLGDCVLFLPAGATCTYALGTSLEVEYTEQNGRQTVAKMTPTKVGN